MKISELTGAALDWAVAKCEGWKRELCYLNTEHPAYSSNWSLCGPIIERERLEITPWPNESDKDLRWQCKQHNSIDCMAFGPTPLIAAMRCYVASKLGEEVEIPENMLD